MCHTNKFHKTGYYPHDLPDQSQITKVNQIAYTHRKWYIEFKKLTPN